MPRRGVERSIGAGLLEAGGGTLVIGVALLRVRTGSRNCITGSNAKKGAQSDTSVMA